MNLTQVVAPSPYPLPVVYISPKYLFVELAVINISQELGLNVLNKKSFTVPEIVTQSWCSHSEICIALCKANLCRKYDEETKVKTDGETHCR